MLPFILLVICEIWIACVLGVSIVSPKHRVWPPPKGSHWPFYVSLIPWIASYFLIVWLGVSTFHTLSLHYAVLDLVGIGLMIFGYLVYYFSRKKLGVTAMFGTVEKLATSGIYRFTRNPSYVGNFLLLTGFSLFCNSLWVYIAACLAMMTFLLAPFAEEPWLEEQYGHEYLDYKTKVPRFFGLPKR